MFSMRVFRCLQNKTSLKSGLINGIQFNYKQNINNSTISRLRSNCDIINTNEDLFNNKEKFISRIEEKLRNEDLDHNLNDRLFDELIDLKAVDPFDTSINNEYLDQISPPLSQSFNLSAFANRSQTLQLFIKLGVNLAEIEKKSSENAEFLLRLDFEKDVKPYLIFLHDNGLHSSDLGHFITKNPLIFKQHLDDLNVRINYLKAKRFNQQMIANVITKAPTFLSFSTKLIDSKLGFLQKEYRLTGDEVRHIVTAYPRIALLHNMHLRESSFMLKEEFGFELNEIKQMLMASPVIWKKASVFKDRKMFVMVFDLIHNEMKIPHELIAKTPLIFTRRPHLIKARHLYLKELSRDQYDPKQPLYVPLFAFYGIHDNEFCDKYARTSVSDFNSFCKTL